MRPADARGVPRSEGEPRRDPIDELGRRLPGARPLQGPGEHAARDARGETLALREVARVAGEELLQMSALGRHLRDPLSLSLS